MSFPAALVTTEILDRVTDAVTALDRDWKIVYVNAAAARIARRPPLELVGRNVWSEYPDVVGTVIEREYRRAVDEQVTVAFEYYYQPFDVWVSVTAFPSSSGLTVYTQDVTPRKKAEQALAKSEARNRMIVETAFEGIWLVDVDYRTVFANRRMLEMLGVDSLAEHRVHDFVVGEGSRRC